MLKISTILYIFLFLSILTKIRISAINNEDDFVIPIRTKNPSAQYRNENSLIRQDNDVFTCTYKSGKINE